VLEGGIKLQETLLEGELLESGHNKNKPTSATETTEIIVAIAPQTAWGKPGTLGLKLLPDCFLRFFALRS
jgi:hypothetical protein